MHGTTIAQRQTPPPKPNMPALPPFIVGVWYQPISSFQKWKDRGINTLVGIETEGTHTPAQVIAAAHAMGFYVIGNDPGADMLLNAPDEPDGAGNVAPPAYVANYKTLKAQQPNKPVFGNFDGEKSRWRPESDYAQPNGYLAGCDVVAMDKYVTNSGTQDEGGWDVFMGRVDFFVRLAQGKPVLVAIECSDQNLRVQPYLHAPENQPQGERWAKAMRCPTPDEMEHEIRLAIAHGAKGIFYFADIIGNGWQAFDGTPADVAARMTTVNAGLSAPSAPPAPAPLPPAKTLIKTITISVWSDGSSDVVSK